MMRCAICPSVTACKCEQMASMWMPSTNSVLGSKTGQACMTKALKLRRALSVFTCSSWNSRSFIKLLELIELFVVKSGEINSWFIVGSMGHVDLFGFGRQSLQQGLHRPGFALAGALPKQGGGLFGSALLDQTGIETFFESQAAACNAGRIAGLSRLPSVAIARLESCLWIARLAWFEFESFAIGFGVSWMEVRAMGE